MSTIQLIPRDLSADAKAGRLYSQFAELLRLLRERQLPEHVHQVIDKQVQELNAVPSEGKGLVRQLRLKQNRIVSYVAKEVKIVPQGYYRNLWMVLGMSVFGVSLGVSFGLAMKNMGLMGIGLPIGMAIGVGVGAAMDKKAAKEGKQLGIALKY